MKNVTWKLLWMLLCHDHDLWKGTCKVRHKRLWSQLCYAMFLKDLCMQNYELNYVIFMKEHVTCLRPVTDHLKIMIYGYHGTPHGRMDTRRCRLLVEWPSTKCILMMMVFCLIMVQQSGKIPIVGNSHAAKGLAYDGLSRQANLLCSGFKKCGDDPWGKYVL